MIIMPTPLLPSLLRHEKTDMDTIINLGIDNRWRSSNEL